MRGRVILERSGAARQYGELYGQIRELEQQCRNFIEQIERWLLASVAETSAAATLAGMQERHDLQRRQLNEAAATLAGMRGRAAAGPPRLGPRGVNQGDPLQEEIGRVQRQIVQLTGARNGLIGQLSKPGMTPDVAKSVTGQVKTIEQQLDRLVRRLNGLRSALTPVQWEQQNTRFTSKTPLRF